MSQAFDMFTNSYFKGLKRPELFGFNPDSAYGANMLHGSESQNPWVGRNSSNAKYGTLGGSVGLVQNADQQTSTPFGSAINMPGTNSTAQNTFSKLLSATQPPLQSYGGVWLGNKLLDMFKSGDETQSGKAVSEAMDNMLLGKTPMSGTEQAAERFIEGTPAKSGVDAAVERFGDKAVESAGTTATSIPMPDPTTIALSMAPGLLQTMTGSKTVGKVSNAAVQTGMAASQEFTNPLSDLMALMSIKNLFF